MPLPRISESIERELADKGKVLHDARLDYMKRHQIGMTETWNRVLESNNKHFKDDEIEELRVKFYEMDVAVLKAYGWNDLAPTDDKEIIARLRKLNAERALEEVTEEYEHLQGLIVQGTSHLQNLNKKIDQELIKALYKIKTLDLNKFRDPSTGYARGSDYNLFVDNEELEKKLEKDLIQITKELVDSDVFFRDSFFTILEGKSTIIKHNHLGSLDKFVNLNLWKQKYSLVYYLSIGDQNCQHPGILKFYKDEFDDNANKEVLPSEGMMVIFPADTYHSVKYDGKKDRIIIGVNFYSI